MRDEVMKFLAPREEKVKLGERTVIVRELGAAVDATALSEGGDAAWKFVVLCTFDADGSPVFTIDDVPALKASAKARVKSLVDAALRVNGFDEEHEIKNSEAGPGAG